MVPAWTTWDIFTFQPAAAVIKSNRNSNRNRRRNSNSNRNINININIGRAQAQQAPSAPSVAACTFLHMAVECSTKLTVVMPLVMYSVSHTSQGRASTSGLRPMTS
jgi:hypothetical protein